MTRTEWDNVMKRWMHRNDISADLNAVFDYAVELVTQRWMNVAGPLFADDIALLKYAGRAMHHAGLIYLHELAQDDVGIGRERAFFAEAMADVQMRWSLDNTNPDMLAKEHT